MKKKAVLFLVVLLSGFASALYGQLGIETGHNSPVVLIQSSPSEEYWISLSTDGFLKLWSTETTKVVGQTFADYGVFKESRFHPQGKYFSLLFQDKSDFYYIYTYSTQSLELLYTLEFQRQPLYFDFSEGGKFLTVSQLDTPTLAFFEAGTGKPLDILKQSASLSTFFYIGPTERNIMTYSSSGKMSYLDLNTGTVALSVDTASNLQKMYISPNKKYLISYRGDQLLLIDRLTGQVKSYQTDEISNLYLLSASPHGLIQFKGNNQSHLKKFAVLEDSLEIFTEMIPLTKDNTSLATMSGSLYVGTTKGNIFTKSYLTPYPELLISENKSVSIFGVSTKDQEVMLSTSEKVIQLSLTEEKNAETNNGVQTFPLETSPSKLRILKHHQQEYFWSPNSNTFFKILQLDGQKNWKVLFTGSNPLRRVKALNNFLYVLENSGKVSILDLKSQNIIFTRFFRGALAIEPQSEESFFVTTSSGDLFTINLKTDEIIPWTTHLDLIFDLAWDNLVQRLYIMGLDFSEGRKTVLGELKTDSYQGDFVILDVALGERLNASLHKDANGESLIMTWGLGDLTLIRWGQLQYLGNLPISSQDIAVENGVIQVINKDQSVDLIYDFNLENRITLHLLKNDLWVAFGPEKGSYVGSEGVEKYLY